MESRVGRDLPKYFQDVFISTKVSKTKEFGNEKKLNENLQAKPDFNWRTIAFDLQTFTGYGRKLSR